MNAILLYRDDTNPSGVPGDWPSQHVAGVDEAPDGRPWILMTNKQLKDHKALHQAAYDSWEDAFFAERARKLAVPTTISAVQFRLWLLKKGWLNTVNDFIDAWPEPKREAVKLEWEYSPAFSPDSRLVKRIANHLEIGRRALEDGFIEASQLEAD